MLRIPIVRLASGAAAAGLLLLPLSACSGESVPEVTSTQDTSAAESSPGAAEDTGTTTPAPETTSADGPAGSAGHDVDCSGTSCQLTLDGAGTEVEVLGNTISLGEVRDGRATIGVGGREVSCSQGESVSAGPLTLECTTVNDDAVTLTASLG